MRARDLRRAAATTVILGAGLAAGLPAAHGTTTKPKAVRHVTVTDGGFNPKTLKVRSGTKVVWKFDAFHSHNVTVDTGPRDFASPTMSSGTFSKTLKSRGTYVLYCTIHNFEMTVKVVGRRRAAR